MARAQANGIEIEYETFGDRGDRPLLLIMGLGTQMLGWDEDFCAALAARGHWVVRFDNRDVGLSTHFDQLGMPDVVSLFSSDPADRASAAPYLVRDMAADAVGLLDALDVPTAHVVGASMGGMIAQTLAIEYPQRVASMTSIMSTTGDPSLPPPTADAVGALLIPSPPDRDGAIQRTVDVFRTIGSPAYPFDEADLRARAGRSYDRCFDPAGSARQLAAILCSGSRAAALGAVRCPALVIHGAADPLVPVAGGQATAAAVSGAELLLIEGMGHDLPRPLWPRIIDAITRLTENGTTSAARKSA